MIPAQIRAILWAQWRASLNFRPAGGWGGRLLVFALGLLWYGIWAVLGTAAALGFSQAPRPLLESAIPWSFLGITAYWQLAPVLSATMGASLDLRKLLVYPIPERHLFSIEVLLRLTTGMEMLLVLSGVTAGLAANPLVPAWAPLLAAAVFAAFNLFLAAGIRNLLERLLAYKRVRELLVFLIVMAAALPQLLTFTGVPPALRQVFRQRASAFWPWSAAGLFACGAAGTEALAVMLLWTAAALVFGRRQFRRGLSFDRAAVEAKERPQAPAARWRAALVRVPASILPDPLAAMLEKELRSLARTPRFRLVFLMGFSFGLLIWFPLFRGEGGWRQGGNYPVMVSGYAMLLLAEVVFWNAFGFDRSAAQLYLCAPVRFSQVLRAKNLAAFVIVLVEVTAVLLVLGVAGVPITARKALEAYAVISVLCLYLLATGNLSSVHYPRAVNPEHTWGRSAGGKFQLFLLFLFPLLTAPVLLAYMARYAWQSELAFWGVLAFAAAAGAAVYWVALDSAVQAGERRKEALVTALTQGTGPVVSE